MFIRFFYIGAALLTLILGCTDPDRAGNSEAVLSIDRPCPQLSLKASHLTKTVFQNLRSMRLEATPTNASIAQIVAPMIGAERFTLRQRLVLEQAALRDAQTTTLIHFMDYGRLLADTAINPGQAPAAQNGISQFSPHEIERFLSALTHSPPPSNHAKTPHDMVMRYILLIWSWASLLEERVQLSQWWHPWEYRWLLEARVLGHFGLELTDRIKANSQLMHIDGYPSQWNEAVLTAWSKKPLSIEMRQVLSESLPNHCLQELERSDE